MNCKNAQSLLSAYVDEELTGQEMLDLRDHLHQCNDCQEEIECIRSVKQLLSTAPVPEPSADFEDRLVLSVLASAPRSHSRKMSILAFTGIAAASMLVTLALLNGMRRETSGTVARVDDMPYEMIQRDRSFSASADPMSGSPVMWVNGGR